MIRSVFFLVCACVFYSHISIAAPNPCSPENPAACLVDEYVGNSVLFEDGSVKIWDFKLEPGEMTSMHRHYCNYYFVAVTSTVLEVFLSSGESSYTFKAEGTMGFRIEGENLVQIGSHANPIIAPRTHAARNIGNSTYHEILFESKTNCVNDDILLSNVKEL